MAQLVIAAAGAAVGFAVGGPAGARWGFMLGSVVGSAFAPSQKQQGPRLEDLRVSGTEYGQPIPILEGYGRTAGQIVWASTRREISTTTEQGKGGGVESTTYTYEVDLLYLLADNECEALARVWNNGKVEYNVLSDADSATLLASANTDLWSRITLYSGDAAQLPDPVYEAAVGASNACAYRGRTTVFIEGLQLGSSGQLPNLTFELGRVNSASTYSTSVLDAPMTTDAEDTIPTAATLTQTSSPGTVVSFGSLGLSVTNLYSGNTFSATYVANKLYLDDATFTGQKATLSVDVDILSYGTLGSTGDTKNFFTYVGSGASYAFGFKLVSGVIHLRTRYLQGGAVEIDHGEAATSANYRFVLSSDQSTLSWYADDLLIRSVGFSTAYASGSVVLNCVQAGTSPGAGVSGYLFKNLLMYAGEAPLDVDLVTLQDETLEDVVTRLCDRAGLASDQFDATPLSAITKPVHSMWISQVTPARQTLETLAAAYYFNGACSNKIYFRPLGGSSVATLAYADLGASESETSEPLELKLNNELERPAQVAVSYINIDGDYNTATEYSQRLLNGQDSTSTAAMSLGFTANEAKGIAETAVAKIAAEFLTTQVSVFTSHSKIEPGDAITVTDGDGSTYRMRVEKRTESPGLLGYDLTVEDASVYIDSAASSSTYTSSSVVATPADTSLVLLDTSILRDADNDSGIYAATKGTTTPWPGAALYKGLDGITYERDASFSESAVVGTCSTTLGDWTGGNVFDETNTVTVSVGLGTLSSETRDNVLDADANACAIGVDGNWEILQFRTATLVTTGVYTLSGLLRGRRGTEWAMTGHASDETFVLLRTTGLRRVTLATSELYQERHYKAVTLGRRLSTATDQTQTCNGVGLMPFAPVHLRGSRSSGDLTGTFDRRTRLADNFSSTTAPPLGESTEAYSIDVYSDGTYTTVLRTISATAETFSYSSADQTTDFGSPQSVVYVRVYQLSATVGRGYAMEGAI